MPNAKRPGRRTRFDQLASLAATVQTQASSIDKLIAALLGKSAITRDSAGGAWSEPEAPAAPSRRVYLTPRELEVARLIVDGLTTPQIATRLTLEPTTIKKHRSHIRKATGTSERAGLTATRETWDTIGGTPGED